MSNFINDCIEGKALYDDIDDYIHAWHIGDSELELIEYLGMTNEEYFLYIKDSNALPIIITKRLENKKI